MGVGKRLLPGALAGLVAMSACAFQSSSKVGEPQGTFGARSLIPLDGRRDVRGRIGALTSGEVVIHTRQGPVRLQTDESTTVFSGGRVGTLADLKQGEPVRASVAEDGGRNVALWIEAAPPRAGETQTRKEK